MTENSGGPRPESLALSVSISLLVFIATLPNVVSTPIADQEVRGEREPLRADRPGAEDDAGGDALATWALAVGTTAGASALSYFLYRRGWLVGAIPLYTRLKTSSMLAHPTRKRILDAIRSHPGIHLAELRSQLGIPRRVVAHHVEKLAQARFVFTTADGIQRRAYPIGHASAQDVAPLEERIVALLKDQGPLRAADVARALSVSRQALHYHVKRLEQQGRIHVERRGWLGSKLSTAR